MSNYLDYKATIWFRIPINSEKIFKKVKKKVDEGTLPAELYDDIELNSELGQCEPLYDTEEFISPNENDGQSTIEIYKDTETVWDNSYESEIKRKQK